MGQVREGPCFHFPGWDPPRQVGPGFSLWPGWPWLLSWMTRVWVASHPSLLHTPEQGRLGYHVREG